MSFKFKGHVLTFFILIATPTLSISQTKDQIAKGEVHYYRQGLEAFADGDTVGYLENFKIANSLRPENARIMENLAKAYAYNFRPNDAIDLLSRLLLIDCREEFLLHEAYDPYRGVPKFQRLWDLVINITNSPLNAEMGWSFTIADIHPESVAPGLNKGEFIFGSIRDRKIIKVTEDGKQTDLVSPAAHGIAGITGLKADLKAKTLWACSAPLNQMKDQLMPYDGTGVFKFDLETGDLIKKYILNQPFEDHLFGDLVLSKDGGAFISDSQSPVIYRINPKSDKLEKWISDSSWVSLQGICLDKKEKFLFIADYVFGIFKIEIATKKITRLSAPSGFTFKGIDGLYFYKNQLIAIQNGVNPMRVSAFKLGKKMEVISGRILENNHPEFGEPTLGFLDGDLLIYIANSPWANYDKNQQFTPPKSNMIYLLKNKL